MLGNQEQILAAFVERAKLDLSCEPFHFALKVTGWPRTERDLRERNLASRKLKVAQHV
jgi:hypothetical protein